MKIHEKTTVTAGPSDVAAYIASVVGADIIERMTPDVEVTITIESVVTR